MENLIIIYGLIDSTNLIKYVGKTINIERRFKEHKREKPWVSYKILGIYPYKEWGIQEKYWISQFPYTQLLNKNKGGGGVVNHSDETRQKISQKHKIIQKVHSDIHHKEKRAKREKGIPLTLDHRQKISLNNAKFWKGKTGAEHPFFGKTHTLEAKLKMSLIKKGCPGYWTGKKRSEETKLKMSLAKKGRSKRKK